MTYTVASERLAGHDLGDTVTDEDLPGANVPALIAAGHLTVNELTKKSRRKPANEESEAG